MTDQRTVLSVSSIVMDERFQQRASIDGLVVADYMWSIDEMPPVDVFVVDGVNYLVDGWHRVAAAIQRERDIIPARIHSGTMREALLYSMSANTTHGIRRTREEKRKCVSAMLADAEWRLWSDNKIAKHCGVSQPFVSAMRKEATVAEASAATGIPMPPAPRVSAPPDAVTSVEIPKQREPKPSTERVTTCPECGCAFTFEVER